MPWTDDLAYAFGGALLTNAIPHFVSGVMGRPFQSPFAKPPGQGLSSSTVNVAWGFVNAVIGYGLVAGFGRFDPRSIEAAGSAGVGVLLMGLVSARLFGRFNGGQAPAGSRADV